MAQLAATAANLDEFAQSLGERLAEEIGQGGGSGDSNFIYVESYVNKEGEIPHLYLVVDSTIDLSGMSLRFGRKGRTKCRRSDKSPYYDNEGAEKLHTVGWHQVWKLPIHDHLPLLTPILKSLTPEFTKGGNAYYEITVDGYESLYEFMVDGTFETGYLNKDNDPLPISDILMKTSGVCLVRDGQQISNWAMFRSHYRSDDDLWTLGK